MLDSIFTDIIRYAIKTGMVASGELIGTIAQKLTEYHAKKFVDRSCHGGNQWSKTDQ